MGCWLFCTWMRMSGAHNDCHGFLAGSAAESGHCNACMLDFITSIGAQVLASRAWQQQQGAGCSILEGGALKTSNRVIQETCTHARTHDLYAQMQTSCGLSGGTSRGLVHGGMPTGKGTGVKVCQQCESRKEGNRLEVKSLAAAPPP